MAGEPVGFDVLVSDAAWSDLAGLQFPYQLRFLPALDRLLDDPTIDNSLVEDLSDVADAPGEYVLLFRDLMLFYDMLNPLVAEVVAVRSRHG